MLLLVAVLTTNTKYDDYADGGNGGVGSGSGGVAVDDSEDPPLTMFLQEFFG